MNNEKKIRAEVKDLLAQNEWKCNAAGRNFVAEKISELPQPHRFDENAKAEIIDMLKYAEEVGGCKPGESFEYLNADGEKATANVYGLYDIPDGLVNPFVVCFSGHMAAYLFAFETVRWHLKTVGNVLPMFFTGKEGNKGLFKSVFERECGLMVKTEAEAYMRCLELMAPEYYVRRFEREVSDTDTKGNFSEMLALAKAQNLKEATFLLCSGNFSYDKRLLAEGMLELAKQEYKGIKINLAVIHCPIETNLSVPEGHISELLLGYVAASLGPLLKDTTPLRTDIAPDLSKERYLLPGVAEADWSRFEDLIVNYSNMGWPNYQELLYGISHEEAVTNIIMADLRARNSFLPEQYDHALYTDIFMYHDFVGRYQYGKDFEEYLADSPDRKFFDAE